MGKDDDDDAAADDDDLHHNGLGDDHLLPSSPATARESSPPTMSISNSDQGLEDEARIGEVELGSSPEVLIRNAAWATHPAPAIRDGPRKESCGSASPTEARVPSAFGVADPLEIGDGSPAEGEGRMPSFRELLGFLCDYTEVRGLRSATESLAMRAVMMLGSIDTDANGDGEGHSNSDSACLERPERRLWGFPRRPCRTGGEPSFVFGALHGILDRPPVWILEALVLGRNLLSCRGQWWRSSSSMNKIPAVKASAATESEVRVKFFHGNNGVPVTLRTQWWGREVNARNPGRFLPDFWHMVGERVLWYGLVARFVKAFRRM